MFATPKPGCAVLFGRNSDCVVFLERLCAIHITNLNETIFNLKYCCCFAKIGLSFAKICQMSPRLPPAGCGELAVKLIANISLEFTKSRVVDWLQLGLTSF